MQPSSLQTSMQPPPAAAQCGAPGRAQRVAALTEANLDDLCSSLGLARHATGTVAEQGRRLLRAAVRRGGRAPAARFAALMTAIDDHVGAVGLAGGAMWGLGALQASLRVVGAHRLPDQGPLLFMANHPGMTDTLALFAAIPRLGLRTIAARRSFLELLPNLSAPLIWVEDEESPPAAGDGQALGAAESRMRAVRAATAHLRGGGALLTFPAGRIEPDPAAWPLDEAAPHDWNPSMESIARLVPNLVIVPTLVSGVISARAAHSPLRRLRRTRDGQDLLSAMLQIAWPPYKTTDVCVRFGVPLPVAALLAPRGRPALTQAAMAVMRALMQEETRDRRSRA